MDLNLIYIDKFQHKKKHVPFLEYADIKRPTVAADAILEQLL